ncbi:hypothetical protein L210DRAFT_3504580 [Boletus edulis BED1]|uniref:Uncharacterized protein n=1 Tax=Boletus edulis BED1 TaxID=1328754 RepID=A0AAD4BS19_BOLED|nr:hypothetical protein L210DRAFT_3504580 [Boletus edulis BED1]
MQHIARDCHHGARVVLGTDANHQQYQVQIFMLPKVGQKVQPLWLTVAIQIGRADGRDYIMTLLKPSGRKVVEEDGDQEKKKVGKLKKSQGRCRDDVIEKILLPDGTVWIPEVQNLTRKVPQEKGQLGKVSQGRKPSPQPDERDQEPYQEHAESGQVKYDPPKKIPRDRERG